MNSDNKYNSTDEFNEIKSDSLNDDKDLEQFIDNDLDIQETPDDNFNLGEETKNIFKEFSKKQDDVVTTSELNNIFAGKTSEFINDREQKEMNFEQKLKNYADDTTSQNHQEASLQNQQETVQYEENFSANSQEPTEETSNSVPENNYYSEGNTANFRWTPSENNEPSLDDEGYSDLNDDNENVQEVEKVSQNDPLTSTLNDLDKDDEVVQKLKSYNENTEQINNADSNLSDDDESVVDLSENHLETRLIELSEITNDPSILEKKIELLEKLVQIYRPAHQMIEKVRNTQQYLQRKVKDVENQEKYAALKFLKEIVEPFHWLELSVKSLPDLEEQDIMRLRKLISNFSKGLEIVLNRFMNTFEKNDVKVINPKQGDAYDERYHEALKTEESDTVESNHIIKTKRKGFYLHDRLIKPAIVIVSK